MDFIKYMDKDDEVFSQVGILDYTGNLTYIIAIHAKAACKPDFTDFPWALQVDRQI